MARGRPDGRGRLWCGRGGVSIMGMGGVGAGGGTPPVSHGLGHATNHIATPAPHTHSPDPPPYTHTYT